MLLMDLGEYLPVLSYYVMFNKTSPFLLPSQIACIKIPYSPPDTFNAFGEITTQVSKTVCNEIVLYMLKLKFKVNVYL